MNPGSPFEFDGFDGFDPSNLMQGHSIDCVIFGYDQQLLHILVIKWKYFDKWSLPGGFIHLEEDLDDAATRVLEERTGLKLPFLHQFHTFGSVNRRENTLHFDHLDTLGLTESRFKRWLTQRFLTTGYLSLVDKKQVVPTPDYLSDLCEWKPLSNLPELLFDHEDIIAKALEQLQSQINYLPIGINLLPSKFTMKDFQNLYESILQKELDRANFQKKMLKLGFLNRLEKQQTGGAHKAPYLYEFDQRK